MEKIEDIINKPIEGKKYFNSGSFGVIYENPDGTLTKVMRYETSIPYSLIKIRELNLDNFYHIYSIACNKKNDLDYLHSYTMNKILFDDSLVLTDNNYLIKNIKILINSINVLSDNYIVANDLHEDNLIPNIDGIFVVDCDNYYRANDYPTDYILEKNLEILKQALYQLILKILKHHHKLIFTRRIKLKNLFDKDFNEILSELSNYENIVYCLKKKK